MLFTDLQSRMISSQGSWSTGSAQVLAIAAETAKELFFCEALVDHSSRSGVPERVNQDLEEELGPEIASSSDLYSQDQVI